MTYKEATRQVIMRCYEQKGKAFAIKKAEEMLGSTVHAENADFRRDVNGELCECVLEIVIIDWIKNHPECSSWRYNKGLVLKNRENVNKNFYTEIDFVLYTPQCIFLFECKSYTGDKELVGQGILKRKNGNSCDVYRQSVLHKEVIEPWVKDLACNGAEPLIQMCMFNFSRGMMVDNRSKAAKIEMPCLNKDSVLDFITIPGDIVWDCRYFPRIKQIFDGMSDKLRTSHLKYVKSLHH